MKSASELKKDLEFNKSLGTLVDVLKTIAVTQYKTLESSIKLFQKLFTHINAFFELVDVQRTRHPFLNPRNKKLIAVAITSDSGLLGGLNAQAVNAALKELGQIPGKLVVIGDRGKAYAQEANVPFVAFSGISENDAERHAQATQLRDYLVDKFFQESAGYLKVIYPKPLSFTVQKIEVLTFLPYVTSKEQAYKKEDAEVIMESTMADVVEYLIYLWIAEKLHEIFGLSRLAEFAARFIHLEESSQKLKDLEKKVRLQYFRARRELVDRNLRDLFGARALYADK